MSTTLERRNRFESAALLAAEILIRSVLRTGIHEDSRELRWLRRRKRTRPQRGHGPAGGGSAPSAVPSKPTETLVNSYA